MKGERGKVYTSAEDFFALDGNIVMMLSSSAAIQVCAMSAGRNLVVFRLEGGFWHNPGFEARRDCIWDGTSPPLSMEAAEENNKAAAAYIRKKSPEHDVFVVSTSPITGHPHLTHRFNVGDTVLPSHKYKGPPWPAVPARITRLTLHRERGHRFKRMAPGAVYELDFGGGRVMDVLESGLKGTDEE